MINFIDKRNFHASNFPALYRMINGYALPVRYLATEHRDLKSAHGQYEGQMKHLAPMLQHIQSLPVDDLLDVRVYGVRLWDVCKYEVVQQLITKRSWISAKIQNRDDVLFAKIVSEDLPFLRMNLASAMYWTVYWQQQFSTQNHHGEGIFAFGNSLSYTRSLLAQAESFQITPVVLEHFFTGRDHYLEVRTSPIQGYNELRLPLRENAERDETLVFQRMASQQNKNVVQPVYRRGFMSEKGPKILLLAQVCNDFAAIGPGNKTLGTIALYKELISTLLSGTSVHLTIKTHPFESVKVPGAGSLTYDELAAYVALLPSEDRSRINLVADYPLESLVMDTDLCVTLNSQSGLEALLAGKPVATLADPFYAGHGFTYDFDNVEDFVSEVQKGGLFELEPSQSQRYMAFMTSAFNQLVNDDDSPDDVYNRIVNLGISTERTSLQENQKKLSRRRRKMRKLVREPKRFVRDAARNLVKKF